MDWITVIDFPLCPFSVQLTSLDQNIGYVNIGNDDDDDVTLDDCLKAFIEPEILVPREASKQLSFWRLPSILVIQLKRFKTHSSSYYHEKINYMIKYPFELNLEKYIVKHNDDQQQSPPPIYELYAIVNHQGRPTWGHYTAFARSSHSNEFGWRLFDDNCVDKITDDREIITSKAYLLFYKRREH
ncbi:hypothetical protein BLA29_002865 [Euroglyphus maynei]|uniref:ubiquitinyl hydrolase 1 n=1 Tax=Euroglyphus maynei TaxID=6958 RepID=A0A1Y3BI97_EURMA|nr:hypothetical protein BLA29_002865 [Euroglyphus maynei]